MKMDKQHVLTEEQKTDVYVRKKMMEAADAREAELNADRSLDSIHLTDAMRADMQRRIAEIDAARANAADAAENVTSCAASQDAAYHTAESDMPENAAETADATYHTTESGVSLTAENTSTAPDVLAMLSEEDRRALELGKKAMRLRKHRKALRAAGIAAVIGLGIFGISMTSEANRLWWIDLWDNLVGKESVSYLQNAEEKGELNVQIQEICAEIKEKTDINAAYFLYMPDDLIFDDYMIREDVGSATMYYLYQEEMVLSVRMVRKKKDSVTGQIKDGEILERIPVETYYGTVEIRVQAGPDEEKNYSVEFVLNDCQYNIHGLVPREEFIELIKNITIF